LTRSPLNDIIVQYRTECPTIVREARDRPDVELFAEVGRIEQLFRNRVERALPAGLSASQFAVLNHFVRTGAPQGPAGLAAAFHLTKGAMTNTLQRLEGQGLVTVGADAADGRRKVVTVTPAGRQAHGAAVVALKPQMDALRAAFPAEVIDAALPFLRELRAWLDGGAATRS
jgi:DNA-binding MarR family transcriptional regulator